MKWEKKILVLDDILSREQQEDLKNELLSPRFPWHFNPGVTGEHSEGGRPAFNNYLIDNGKVNVGGKPLDPLQQLTKIPWPSHTRNSTRKPIASFSG